MSTDQQTPGGAQLRCIMPLYETRRDGVLHNARGPARKWPDGTLEWFYDGERHRLRGPAIVYHDGTTEYWRHGKMVQA